MKPYVIRQGDSLATLASRRGFDADIVWNDKQNDSLRNQRKDSHVLASGDIIYLPDPQVKELPLVAGTVNRYVATMPLLHASISCTGPDGKTLAGKAFYLDDVLPKFEGTTDGNGVADFSFPVHVSTVHVHFPDVKLVIVANVAHLDPITEDSGVAQRLSALGVLKPAPGVSDPEAHEAVAAEYLLAAIRAFQKQEGIPETGVIDDATRDALVRAHGA